MSRICVLKDTFINLIPSKHITFDKDDMKLKVAQNDSNNTAFAMIIETEHK